MTSMTSTTPMVSRNEKIAAAIALVVGIVLYASGYTYEGRNVVSLVAPLILVRPYFRKLFSPWAAVVVLLPILPVSMYGQTFGAELGNWAYPTDDAYLLGRITAQGEGPGGWTRLLWLGAESPTVDVFYYPFMAYLEMACFVALLFLVPARLRANRIPAVVFHIFMVALTIVFCGLPIWDASDMPVFDYTWVVMSSGIPCVWVCLALSPSFGRLIRQPVWWIWVFGWALYTGAWESLTICGGDYWYVLGRSMSPMLTCGSGSITWNQPGGYVLWAIVFPAMLSGFHDVFHRATSRRPGPEDRRSRLVAESWFAVLHASPLKRALVGAGGLVAGAVSLSLLVPFIYSEAALRREYDFTVQTAPIPADLGSRERGRHLVESVGLCTECHGSDLGGGVKLDLFMVGRVAGPNLTPGLGSAVAEYTPEDWFRSIRHGVGRDRRALLFMPASDFASHSLEDTASMIAYLQALPPVDRETPASVLQPLMQIAFFLGQLPQVISADTIDHDAPAPAHLRPQATAEYGQRLAAGCVGCHGEHLSGGRIPGTPPSFPAAGNLTRHSTGLLAWSRADFGTAMRTGVRPDGTVLGDSMPWRAYAGLTDLELDALWRYLSTLAPREHGRR